MFEQRGFFHLMFNKGFGCEAILFVSLGRKRLPEGLDIDDREITNAGCGSLGWI